MSTIKITGVYTGTTLSNGLYANNVLNVGIIRVGS
jgi:hypothetical protein